MDNNWGDIREFVLDYNFVDRSLSFVLIEIIITAFIIGGFAGVGWGVGSFIIILFLYGIPLIGGVFTYIFSFVEAFLVGGILSLTGMSLGWLYFVTVVAFVVLTHIHMAFGGIDNPALLGYSLIIFFDLLICLALYALYNSLLIVGITFIGVLVVAFIPGLRVLELIALSIGTAIFAYGVSCGSLGTGKAALFAAFTLIYSGSLFYQAYAGVDYVGMRNTKKREKIQAENNNRRYQIKSVLYEQFPDLEKNYYYFYTDVCQSDFQKMQFNFDWNNYLEYLYETSDIISFNEYFEQEKLYRTSNYNSDFAKKHTEWGGTASQQKTEEAAGGKFDGINSMYFAGINDKESLKKRYHDLMKIYHPDNQNGNTQISKQIQEEYEELLKGY